MPLAFLWTGSRNETAGLDMLKKAQIPLFYTPNRLATGIRSLLNYHHWSGNRSQNGFPKTQTITPNQQAVVDNLSSKKGIALSEHESKNLLAEWGIPVTKESLVSNVDKAVAAADEIGYPVVMKADVTNLPHKTDAGLVKLSIRNRDEVRKAFDDITSNFANSGAVGATFNGISIQEMVKDAVEVIVGISYDSQLGATMLFGSGGVLVEVYNDIALRLCPLDESDAFEMISEVKGSRLLEGFRGSPAADSDALVEALVRMSQLGDQLGGTLAELDINPLMVLPAGRGVKAADAVAVLR